MKHNDQPSLKTFADMARESIPADTYLVDEDYSQGFGPVGGFCLSELTEAGKLAWADVLDAKILRVQPGAYGTEYVLDGVDPKRMTDFTFAIAGQCSHAEYAEWFTEEPEEGPAPAQEMRGPGM